MRLQNKGFGQQIFGYFLSKVKDLNPKKIHFFKFFRKKTRNKKIRQHKYRCLVKYVAI